MPVTPELQRLSPAVVAATEIDPVANRPGRAEPGAGGVRFVFASNEEDR
jgi:hypothetical protein